MPLKRKLRQFDNEPLLALEDQLFPKKFKNEQSDGEEGKEININDEGTYREVLEHLYNQRDSEDRPLWKMFDVLPSKEEFPVYYDFIQEPIDLKTVKKKIQSHQYNNIDELEVDILLVFKNAHAFNEPKSQISKDATALKKAYLAKRIELNKSLLSAKVGKRLKLHVMESRRADSEQSDTDEVNKTENTSASVSVDGEHKNKMYDPNYLSPIAVSSPIMDQKDNGLIDPIFEPNVFSTLYNMVVSYHDSTGRQLAFPFLRLPIRRLNADFYDIIKRPLSLGKIRTKIKASYYSDLNILYKDMSCVFENGQLYNREGSVLHADAVFLQQLTNEKKSELEQTTQYIEMRELMPKRGRPKLTAKGDGDDSPQTPVVRKKAKQRETLITPEFTDPKLLKERFLVMYNIVFDYKDSEGRSLASMFLELPDPLEYPDYYKVIPHPIDMDKIHEKIENNEYTTDDDFIRDFEILFQNARHYNEEGSEIYEDSVILEKALKKKRRYLNHAADGKNSSPGKNRQNSPSSLSRKSYAPGQFSSKCQELLHHIRSYVDDTDRILSAIFEKLPSRVEYPDYFLLIKRPIDLAFIASRVHKYPSVDDLEQDLLLLFNNACIYNDPDSQIYKDALTLLRLMIKKKAELVPEDDRDLPDVYTLVQTLMLKLFNKVMDHRDEEGRCYSDSLLEVTVDEEDKVEGEKKRKPITLPIIGQLLQLGFYKRIDILQDDIFSILKKARINTEIDSEMYEDACELHTYFILERDCLMKDGVRMISPALNISGRLVQQEIDAERKEKQQSENKTKVELDEDGRLNKRRFTGAMIFEVLPDEDDLIYSRYVIHENVTYKIGDFAYVKPEDPSRPPNVISIDKIWTQKDGLQGIQGCWYYRPEATFHLASRKFMEKELFRTLQSSFIMLKGVIGRCYVMNVKEYMKFKPQDFKDEDIFVCESKYSTKSKSFMKFKMPSPAAPHITMINRSELLQVKRVASIFATSSPQCEDKKDNHIEEKKVELISSEGYEIPMDKSCEIDVPNPEEGYTYYEKYRTEHAVWKVGDCVYVKTEEDYTLLSKIDKLWTDSSGVAYFQGNWFILPEDTKHLPTQFFMEQECFESNIEDVNPVSMIVEKCSILNQRDYQLSRPTEIPEKDVYMCSAHYNEDELKFRRNMKGFKKLSVSELIREDEYWFFDQPYQSKRRPSLWLTSEDSEVFLKKNEETDMVEDIDNIGFVLMKKEYAATLMKENTELPIEEIANKTDEKWASLTEDEKEEFKSRAKNQGLGDEHIFIYQCCWLTCQYQFEDLQDLLIHVMEGAHLGDGTATHSCEWRDCIRIEEKKKPFRTHSRLVRHIREIHFKHARKKILVSQKTKFYFPRHQTCEEMYKTSEHSDRPSSRDSSTASSLSPSGHLKNNRQLPCAPGMMPNVPTSQMFPNPMHMEAGMFPPYRMNSQPTPQAIMQQQIMQQQQMMIQARGQMMPNPAQRPQMMAPPPPQHPQQAVSSLLSVDQQQMLISQVQRQQQQIQKLQQQVQQLLVQQQQQKQALEEQQEQQNSPIFVSPPSSTQKLRHSEAYLRYIEGLRDNKSSLSSWKELADSPHPKVSNNLPTHWAGDQHNFDSAVDALWALRDHMLREAVSISKCL